MLSSIFYIFVFPGFLFLVVAGFAAEYIDRKLYAKLQNRIGPPWFQPVADFIKLITKEEVIPDDANPTVFKLMPIFALASSLSAIFYIPLWTDKALFSFNGDLVVLLYLLTIPSLTLFLGGWYSTSLYSKIGAVRSMTQLFAYEVPLFISILSPALFANTWSLAEMTQFYHTHGWYWLINIAGFAIAIIALLGKLEKVPFDIPEAETEIVAGTLTEYSGRLLGLFRLNFNVEAVIGSSLLAAVFMPFWLNVPFYLGIPIFIAKILLVIAIMSLARTLFARLRIDQMIDFCWKFLAPVAFAQLLLNLVLKGALPR